jgi:hypothetical protein
MGGDKAEHIDKILESDIGNKAVEPEADSSRGCHKPTMCWARIQPASKMIG